MKRTRAGAVALVAALGSAIASAESADIGPPRCADVGIAAANPVDGVNLVSAGHITAGPALHLELSPGEVCDPRNQRPGGCTPNLGAGVHGVLIHRYKSWRCVVVPTHGKLATATGWIPASRWADDVPAGTRPWVGIWQNGHAKLSITARDGRLHIVGNAIWQGIGDPRFGSFTFDAPMDRDVVGLAEGCEVQIRKVGNFLFAQDNQQCGGINVSFDGLYRYRGDLRP